MNASLWQVSEDKWAICDGPEPTDVKGYVFKQEEGWLIEGDRSGFAYVDQKTAMHQVLGYEVKGITTYMISKENEHRTVQISPEGIKILEKRGWRKIAQEREQQ